MAYDIFISYRRCGGFETAKHLYDLLTKDGYRVSFDIDTLRNGDFDTELCEEFWLGFVRRAECALHLRSLAGHNSHHIIEGAFKSAARSLRQAVSLDPAYAGDIPSTKGVL